MKNKSILLILAIFTSITAQAWNIEDGNSHDWLHSLEAQHSVYTEMNKYFTGKNASDLSSEYIQNFIPQMHSKISNEAGNFIHHLNNASECEASINVSFPKQLTSGHIFNSKQSFESNFLKVESNACLGKLNIDKVFATLMSADFQKVAINGFERLHKLDKNTNEVCLETDIFGLGKSSYCVIKKVLRTDNQYFIHSYNTYNANDVDTTIYFKETINVITEMENGEISLYNLMYARGKNLSFTGIVRSKTEEQQEKVSELLMKMAK